jgi:hypothetical protein
MKSIFMYLKRRSKRRETPYSVLSAETNKKGERSANLLLETVVRFPVIY